MICAFCGKPIPEGQTVCPGCGMPATSVADLNAAAPIPEPAPTPAPEAPLPFAAEQPVEAPVPAQAEEESPAPAAEPVTEVNSPTEKLSPPRPAGPLFQEVPLPPAPAPAAAPQGEWAKRGQKQSAAPSPAPKQGGDKKRLLLIAAAAAVVLLVVICVVIVALSGDKDPTDDATDVSGESMSASEEATGEQSSTDYVTDAESTTATEGGQDTNAEDPSTIGPQENEVHDDRENSTVEPVDDGNDEAGGENRDEGGADDAAEIPETKGVVESTTADAEIPERKEVV